MADFYQNVPAVIPLPIGYTTIGSASRDGADFTPEGTITTTAGGHSWWNATCDDTNARTIHLVLTGTGLPNTDVILTTESDYTIARAGKIDHLQADIASPPPTAVQIVNQIDSSSTQLQAILTDLGTLLADNADALTESGVIAALTTYGVALQNTVTQISASIASATGFVIQSNFNPATGTLTLQRGDSYTSGVHGWLAQVTASTGSLPGDVQSATCTIDLPGPSTLKRLPLLSSVNTTTGVAMFTIQLTPAQSALLCDGTFVVHINWMDDNTVSIHGIVKVPN